MACTIFYTKGLPGSGKSSWAHQMCQNCPGVYKLVDKDSLRAMLDCSKWTPQNEKFLLRVRDFIVREALKDGKHVIVHDTGFEPRHSARFQEIAKELRTSTGKEFRVECVDFTHVPVEECIKRDLQRQASVGEKVIRDMHNRYLRKKADPPPYDDSLPDCVIVDVDGTVALMNGRGPFDWHRVGEDLPNRPVIDAVNAMATDNVVVFVSGRDECCREETARWLEWNLGWKHPLFMRPAGDTRDDRIVKREIYDREIRGKYNVLSVFDDLDRTTAMWRYDLGLTCFQVAEGNF